MGLEISRSCLILCYSYHLGGRDAPHTLYIALDEDDADLYNRTRAVFQKGRIDIIDESVTDKVFARLRQATVVSRQTFEDCSQIFNTDPRARALRHDLMESARDVFIHASIRPDSPDLSTMGNDPSGAK